MHYRTIPTTDLHASVICLGALPFGISLDEATSFTLMDQFTEAGGNFIDTALVYGEWLPNGKGLNEQTIGRWITTRCNRRDLIIGTKGAHPRLATMDIPRLSRDAIVSDLDESLRNLQTDYIDLYWLHRDDPNRPVEEILQTLNEQLQAGKIRAFGCSNWKLARIQEAQVAAAAHGMRAFAGNQLMWSLAVPNLAAHADPSMVPMDAELLAYHRTSGLAAMAYTSQARGFFAKLHGSSMAALPEKLRAAYDNAENSATMARLEQLAQERGLPVSALALAYITSQPFPSYAIAGCSTLEQLRDNLQAGAITLEPSLVAWLAGGD